MGLFVAVSEGQVVVYGSLPGKPLGSFAPDAGGCIQLGALFAAHGVTDDVMCSSSCDFPGEYGLPGFDANGFIADALRGAANLRAAEQGRPAPDSPEGALEAAHLAVVDTVVEHLDECPPAVREAVMAWRAAGEAFVQSLRTRGSRS